MDKRELFDEVLLRVCEVTGMERGDVLRSNREECTDARYLLIRALGKLGLTDGETAALMGKTRQAVGYMRTRYKKTGKWTLENDWKKVSKWIENKYFTGK